ncbi:MAG: hypothetical protein RH949_24145 [Coleofasciculus sp. A1-SPW-01]|uniref:hypothetical protein n=1 Tax=Coleofasciculus sp. A1-SPW-01 TaxID=3070819 RepID=UPI0032F19E5E
MSSVRFLSLTGAAATLIALTSCGNPQTSTPTTPEANGSPATTSQTTASPSTATDQPQDIDYMTTLGLMKGHLLIAKELLDQGKPDQAEPHIGHPIEELYADVETQLSQRNVEDFKPTLNILHDFVKSKPNAPEINTEYKAAMQGIDQAIEALPISERQSPDFILRVISQMLSTVEEEYNAAIANDKIVETIEYQDSRGFILYANTLYQDIAEQVSQEHPDAAQTLESSLNELQNAVPSATPPATPVMTPEEVSTLIQTIQKTSQTISSSPS